MSDLARDGKKKANRVKLTLNKEQMKNVVMNLTSIWQKKKNLSDSPPMYLCLVEGPPTKLLASSDRFALTLARQ